MQGKLIEKTQALDYRGQDLIHTRLEFDEKRKLENFGLSYTSHIQGRERAIVRYDSSHGYVHIHRLYRNPPPKKPERLDMPITIDTVKECYKEIVSNYETWKSAFIRNYRLGV